MKRKLTIATIIVAILGLAPGAVLCYLAVLGFEITQTQADGGIALTVVSTCVNAVLLIARSEAKS